MVIVKAAANHPIFPTMEGLLAAGVQSIKLAAWPFSAVDMVNILNLYMDDSGTRNPDHDSGRKPQHKHDWFALGGFVATDEEEGRARGLHANFCSAWKITYPLRSADIRAKTGNFRWLLSLEREDSERFYEQLYQFMATSPVLGIACTIDRPGYNHRYREKYGRQRWQLCKTAFSITVERAAKHARKQGCKLRVHVERGDKKTDRIVKAYYDNLKAEGMPFAGDTSGKYAPLTAEQFRETLYEFRTKKKSSPMAQLADLYLWPMAIGGYDKANRPYSRLISDKKLIDCQLQKEEIEHLGCKYSCFDLVYAEAQKHKDPDCSGS